MLKPLHHRDIMWQTDRQTDGRQHKTHHGGCVHVSLELFLSDEVIEQLHDFEEECLDAYFHEGERKQLCSVEERIRLTTERSVITDHIQSIQLNDTWNFIC